MQGVRWILAQFLGAFQVSRRSSSNISLKRAAAFCPYRCCRCFGTPVMKPEMLWTFLCKKPDKSTIKPALQPCFVLFSRGASGPPFCALIRIRDFLDLQRPIHMIGSMRFDSIHKKCLQPSKDCFAHGWVHGIHDREREQHNPNLAKMQQPPTSIPSTEQQKIWWGYAKSTTMAGTCHLKTLPSTGFLNAPFVPPCQT